MNDLHWVPGQQNFCPLAVKILDLGNSQIKAFLVNGETKRANGRADQVPNITMCMLE